MCNIEKGSVEIVVASDSCNTFFPLTLQWRKVEGQCQVSNITGLGARRETRLWIFQCLQKTEDILILKWWICVNTEHATIIGQQRFNSSENCCWTGWVSRVVAPRGPAVVMTIVVIVVLQLCVNRRRCSCLCHCTNVLKALKIAKTDIRYFHSGQIFRHAEIIWILFVFFFLYWYVTHVLRHFFFSTVQQ